ncbi:MAG: type I 3-dehydroquinate dehydratase [Gemmataceae bacterium]
MVAAEIQEAAKRGANFIELRLDFLARAVDFKRFTPYKQCPWVATLRRPVDGGRYPGTEADRQTTIRQAIVSGAFEWVDLEMDIAPKIPRFGKVQRIISYHNFSETPTDLEGIYAEMLKLDADVYKVAVLAQSPEDVMRVVNPANSPEIDRRIRDGRYRAVFPLPGTEVWGTVDLHGIQQGTRRRTGDTVSR